jgi:hypothetical protein
MDSTAEPQALRPRRRRSRRRSADEPRFRRADHSHFVQARRDATREHLVRAPNRGEIAANTDLEVTLDLLYGPVYHRLLHGPLTERFAQQVIGYVIAAISEKEHTESQ